MTFSKLLALTVLGAMLTVGVHKVFVETDRPGVTTKDWAYSGDGLADLPIQTVRYRPDTGEVTPPAGLIVNTPMVADDATPETATLPLLEAANLPTTLQPDPDAADAQPIVIVYAPEDHPLGRIRPQYRGSSETRLGDIRPTPRGDREWVEDTTTGAIRPRARIANLAPPTQQADPAIAEVAFTEEQPAPSPMLALAMPDNGRAANCSAQLTRAIPRRSGNAISGSQIVKKSMNLSGKERDAYIAGQLLAGNVPSFMRKLTAVRFEGRSGGRKVEVVICVTPDYLSAGNDGDFVRVPMGLPAAARVADKFGFMLPTTKMVDAIYAQAGVKMAPSPMTPTARMSSTSYLAEHNRTVEGQRVALSRNPALLTAGQKKDLVLSNRLRTKPGRVAIYGWHRRNGAPIQPLSTVHGALYADYSHGIRLVSDTAYVNGRPVPLAKLLEDPQLAGIVSKEGPIARPGRLMASLYRR